MKLTESAENSVAFGKAPRKGCSNTRVSHLLNQSGSQSVSQAGRQAGRTTQFVFWWRPTSTGRGERITCSAASWLSGHSAQLSHADPLNRIPGRQSAAGHPGTVSYFADQGSNPSGHKLLTPQPPTPPKKGAQIRGSMVGIDRLNIPAIHTFSQIRGGGGGLKIEKFIGDHFVSQNDDFTRDRHPIPYCMYDILGHANDPQKGGVYGACACA